VIDFGEVCVKSTSSKNLEILNSLDQPIYVELEVKYFKDYIILGINSLFENKSYKKLKIWNLNYLFQIFYITKLFQFFYSLKIENTQRK